MPTKQQLYDRWERDFLWGREVYSDTPNIRGSAYVGRTKGWLEIESEHKQM